MIRIRKTAASVLGALLVLGACGVASAQSTTGNTGNTNAPSTGTTGKLTAQESFDREKVTLKDQVQDAINSADQNIDALKKLEKSDKGDANKRDKDMEKKLSDLRDNLKKDRDKIDKAAINDWPGVKPYVERDLSAMDGELKTASNVTHVALPTGAANKQPQSAPEQGNPPSNTQP